MLGTYLFMKTNFFNPVIKFVWRMYVNFFCYMYKDNTLVSLNGGFAEPGRENGIYLQHLEDNFDVFRYQLYDYVVKSLGEVESMDGKTLLETGCGRGGGLNYISK